MMFWYGYLEHGRVSMIQLSSRLGVRRTPLVCQAPYPMSCLHPMRPPTPTCGRATPRPLGNHHLWQNNTSFPIHYIHPFLIYFGVKSKSLFCELSSIPVPCLLSHWFINLYHCTSLLIRNDVAEKVSPVPHCDLNITMWQSPFQKHVCFLNIDMPFFFPKQDKCIQLFNKTLVTPLTFAAPGTSKARGRDGDGCGATLGVGGLGEFGGPKHVRKSTQIGPR